MAKLDLSKMDHDQLLKLQKDVDQAIRTYEKRRIEEARAAVEARARELGFSLTELTGGKGKGAKSINPPKYRNPANPDQTWSGRGRRPEWVKGHLAAGKDLEKLRI